MRTASSATVTIYHNPRCSKSRQTLALLEQRGLTPRVVEYLSEPPSAETLRDIISKLGIAPHELLRKGEREFSDLGLSHRLSDEAAIIEAMVEHPILIERPIVVAGDRARLGRPPDAVLEILP